MTHPEAHPHNPNHASYDDRKTDATTELFPAELVDKALTDWRTEQLKLSEVRSGVELGRDSPTWRIDDATEVLAAIDIPRGNGATEADKNADNGRILLGRNEEIGYFLAGPNADMDTVRAAAEGHAVAEGRRPIGLGEGGVKMTVGRSGLGYDNLASGQSVDKLGLGSLGTEVGPDTSRTHLVVQIEADGRIEVRNHSENGLVVRRPTETLDARNLGVRAKLRNFGRGIIGAGRQGK